MKTIQYPESNDLRDLVRFCEKDGTIWLDESRMILMHTAALGTLRKELIQSVGKDHTRRVLTRMGYASGVAMPNWPNAYGATNPFRTLSSPARSCTCSRGSCGSRRSA